MKKFKIRYMVSGGVIPQELDYWAHCRDCASHRFTTTNRDCRILVIQG